MDGRERFTLIRLADEAINEHARLTRFRRVLAGSRLRTTSRLGADVVVAFSRRSSLRRRLHSRVLVLLETTLEDACGTIHAARSTALLVSLDQRLPRAEAKHRLPQIAQATKRLAVDDESNASTWTEYSVRLHAAFWNARRRRERSIAASLSGNRRHPFQAGLFDLRNQRARAEERLRDDETAGMSRGDLIEAMASPLKPVESRVTLVLVPWRS